MSMSIVSNNIRFIAYIHNVRQDVRDEALRLAAVATPHIGRAGWAVFQAEDILAQAQAGLEEARLKRAAAERARFIIEKAAADKAAAERAAAERAALEAAGKAAGGFGLEDINPYFYNCGHYPEWEVVAGGEYPTLEAAEAAAARKNAASNAAWQQFLNPRRG